MSSQIKIQRDTISEFCCRNNICRLALFGSVLRNDFRADSDVDVLVEFDPSVKIGLISLAGLEIDLSRLLGRKTELHTVKGLNPLFRNDVLNSAEVQYEQA